MRPVGGTQNVVGVADIGDPVAHRFIDSFLQRCLSRGDGNNLGAEKAHAGHIEGLPLHVDGPHVDDTLEAKAGGDGSGCHAVLACSGLRDNSLLAHTASEQDLADGIVDLVGAGVEQVLALEVNLCTSELPGQPFGEVEGSGPSDKLTQKIIELFLKGGIMACRFVFALKIEQRRHQSLWDEATSVRTEVTMRVGDARDVG